MFGNQRKMMRTRNSSQWKHQQKSYQDKGEFYQKTWEPSKPEKLDRSKVNISKKAKQIKKMTELENFMSSHENDQVQHFDQDFDYYYSDGQVNLSNFVCEQFKFNMDDVCEKTADLGEKVASNSLILKEILTHLDFSSLKTARLVSREWKTMANSELGKRNCCRMRFKRDFLWNEDFDLEVLRNSLDLSWMEFDLENLDETELEYILTFCAGQIKMLKAPPSNFLLRLLHAAEFPNLKSLYFKTDWNYESATTTMRNPLEREFRNLLKLLRQDSNSTADEAKSKPTLELERLVIEDKDFEMNPEFRNEISRILESSQKSLKFLGVPSVFYFGLSGIFSQLSTIHFRIHGQYKYFPSFQLPRGFDQGNFPNLKTVRFEFIDCGWSFNFPFPQNLKVQNSVCFKSVVNLELGYKAADRTSILNYLHSHSLPSEWFPWMFASFPNVQNLTVSNWRNEDSLLRQVFTVWPNLVTLEIHSDFNIRGNRRNLDSVFTGISPEKCKELSRQRKSVPMSKEMKEMKTWPNLNSLKGLKRLDIRVIGVSFGRPLSKISCLYAFDLNPELEVALHYSRVNRSNFSL